MEGGRFPSVTMYSNGTQSAADAATGAYAAALCGYSLTIHEEVGLSPLSNLRKIVFNMIVYSNWTMT